MKVMEFCKCEGLVYNVIAYNSEEANQKEES